MSACPDCKGQRIVVGLAKFSDGRPCAPMELVCPTCNGSGVISEEPPYVGAEMKKHKLACCSTMLKAQESGTDNEGYGRLVSDYGDWSWHMGCGLPEFNYCPWCGNSVRPEPPTPGDGAGR